ncbi:MAG: hypothetical protein P1U83_11915 [Roseovarius sp.]|nr:hypothetical protein [Roseovarius sp.]
MAPVAFILGAISGTLSALFGMVLFGLSLWGATQVYFCVGAFVAALLIVVAILTKRSVSETANSAKPSDLQKA